MNKLHSSVGGASTSTKSSQASRFNRRAILKLLAAGGIGSAVFQRALAAAAANNEVTAEMIQQAEWVAGIELTDQERQSAARGVQRLQRNFESLRKVEVDYSTAPALVFHPAAWFDVVHENGKRNIERSVSLTESSVPKRPSSEEDLAFLPVTELAGLLRTRQISSLELTRMYLARLKKYDPALHCVVSLTEETALQQAQKADREIARGHYRGPLHGVPWGAKDLISYPGYKTTWGAGPYENQTLPEKATVARRLEDAGAVLIAKLSLGALAMGDRWFGGMTRNPWNVEQGSSGSSAGSASATAAGLVGFTLGSETLGSIVSPCRRCGVTGLRPTFGRVSRHGCMPLAWSMDKIGPIARTVEDCALVFAAIHGADGFDFTAVDAPFQWPPRKDLRSMTVGYFRRNRDQRDKPDNGALDNRPELKVLRELGVKLVPIELPRTPPAGPLTLILDAEAATMFDDLTRNGVREGIGRWPSSFHRGQFTPAVEYLRACRVRTLLMKQMEVTMRNIDAYVGGNDLVITNFTGHPTVVMPNGLTQRGPENSRAEVPTSITFTGKLYGESDLLALAHAYQRATGHHLHRPPMDKLNTEQQQE